MRNDVGVLHCPDSAVRRSEHGRDATYAPADGDAFRVVARRADAITGFGEARLWSETTRFDLRVSEVANPRTDDRLVIDGDTFVIQGEPLRDRERLVWTQNVRLE